MAKGPVNRAASIKDRLLNLARRDGRVFEIMLVRYALERLLYRLSVSEHRDRFILKGVMLVLRFCGSGLMMPKSSADVPLGLLRGKILRGLPFPMGQEPQENADDRSSHATRQRDGRSA